MLVLRDVLAFPATEVAVMLGTTTVFENADAAALQRLLTAGATLEATPMRTRFAGRKTCVRFLRNQLLGSPGAWRMLATSANGQPAAAVYTRDQDGNHRPYGICVLTVTSAGIRRVSSFGDPGLVTVFGFRRTWHEDLSSSTSPAEHHAAVTGHVKI